jgi:hypothetical protein
MGLTRSALYGGTITNDTSPSGGSALVRNADGSGNLAGVGLITTAVANSGGVVSGVIVLTSTPAGTVGADKLYSCNCTSGVIAPPLPPASASAGMELSFVKTDSSANAMTITANGTDKILTSGGGAGAGTVSTTTQGARFDLWCDGTIWTAK